MNGKKIIPELYKSFRLAVGKFEEKRWRFSTELRTDLEALRISYGAEVVKMVINDSSLVTTIQPNTLNISSATATPTDESLPKNPRRNRRKRRGNLLSFSDLIPHVVTSLPKLRDQQFTKHDVAKQLRADGVSRFKLDHIGLIMTRNLTGVIKDGKVPSVKKGVPPLNAYRVMGIIGEVLRKRSAPAKFVVTPSTT